MCVVCECEDMCVYEYEGGHVYVCVCVGGGGLYSIE